MTTKDKIQHLLITHLLKEGQIELKLPDGLVLEIGITQENKNGNFVKTDDYCWLIASQEDRTVSIDSYNLGLRYTGDTSKIIFEHDSMNAQGEPVKILDVV